MLCLLEHGTFHSACQPLLRDIFRQLSSIDILYCIIQDFKLQIKIYSAFYQNFRGVYAPLKSRIAQVISKRHAGVFHTICSYRVGTA